MPIDFGEVPANNKSPAVFGEFDPIGAPGQLTHTILVIGMKLAAGTVPALTPTLISGKTEGDGYFGAGSQLARMLRAIKAVNTTSKVIAIALDEPGAGAAAAGTFTVTGPATADGELAVYIGGERVPVEVNNGDAAAAIATALEAAIDANTQLPVTAGVAAAVVTATARHKGADGNQIAIGVNLRDTDRYPTGVSVALSGATLAAGAGNPDLATVVAVLEEQVYDSIVCGITDSTEVLDLVTEVARRWEATVMLDGHVFQAARGNLAALLAIGNAKNAPELTIMGAGTSPTPPWIWAAQVAGAEGKIANPGTPRFGLLLPDCLPPPVAERFDHSERNLLLADGISTHRVDSGGRVIIDRLVTTYQTNAFGGEDDTWEALTQRRKASFLRRDWVSYVQARYPDYMLAADGTQVDPGVKVVTPSVLKGEALAWYKAKERAGHVEQFDAFRASLISERNAGDPTRVDQLQEPFLTKELVTIATKFAFV